MYSLNTNTKSTILIIKQQQKQYFKGEFGHLPPSSRTLDLSPLSSFLFSCPQLVLLPQSNSSWSGSVS